MEACPLKGISGCDVRQEDYGGGMDLPVPAGPNAEASILAYAAPLIARMRLNRDGLLDGLRPMAHRTYVRSPIVNGLTDPLALNDGVQPSDAGRGIADSVTQAIGHAERWAVEQLVRARGHTHEEAKTLLEGHVVWNVMALMTVEEIEILSEVGEDEPSS